MEGRKLQEVLLVKSSGRRAGRRSPTPRPDVRVCRICFASHSKLYSLTNDKFLLNAYENLTGLLMENDDNLPVYLCCECARQLMNFARFRNTSLRAHLTLLDIVRKHDCVTLEIIQSMKSSINSNQTGDIELTDKENIYGDEILHIRDVPDIQDVTNSIKTEIDVIDEKNPVSNDTTKDDAIHKGTVNNVIINGIKVENNKTNTTINDGSIDAIKTENDDFTNQDIVSNEVTIHKDEMVRIDMPVDGIKVEEIEGEIENNGLSINVSVDGIKLENFDDINQEINNDDWTINEANAVQDDENVVKGSENTADMEYTEHVWITDTCVVSKKPLSNAEICRNYRKRKKEQNKCRKFSKIPNTNAENCRNYRLRKKMREQGYLSTKQVVNTMSISALQNKLGVPVTAGGDCSVAEGRQKMLPKVATNVLEGSPRVHNLNSKAINRDSISCKICPYRANTHLQLSNHLEAHAANVSYSCTECPYITVNKQKYAILMFTPV